MAIDGFTTRPELAGTFGMVASTHYLATAAGMAILERGGNAFDAAVAAAFTLHVVEPHLNGPAGDAPIILATAADPVPRVLCGQGPAPAAATVERFEELGLDLIPGTGQLAAVVPGAMGAWLTLLRDHGTLPLRDVIEFALGYAEHGHPLAAGVARTIGAVAEQFRTHWTDSAAQWLPGGQAPVAGQMLALPALAATYRRLLSEAEAAGSDREAQIEAAYQAWYQGFVAEAIDAFGAHEVMDESGRAHRGLLSGADLAAWRPGYEPTASLDWHGVTVHKAGAWSQGPALLLQLGMLEALGELPPHGSAERIHRVTEVAKLAFADREAYFGDSPEAFAALPDLLDPAYLKSRAALVGESASAELRPGSAGGRTPRLAAFLDSPAALADSGSVADAMVSVEKAEANGRTRGDTCHIDVVDRWGNIVSATPSGAWLQSNPTIPELGFCLGTRAQMFWLERGLPNSLAPGKRPRTTLSPSMLTRDGVAVTAFGTPGGDQQDQWQLLFLLNHVVDGLDLQASIDAPAWHSTALPNSFTPRTRAPLDVVVEGRFPQEVFDGLRGRGHIPVRSGPWSLGRISAVSRDPGTGVLRAGANPRGMQGYAAGR
ncbi:gamma-glutamyltransferase [Actinospica durhamensis]|uniref:Gamma-glutamyltransferase n=1 Tax=Actinospica durhamensis TaxID=1508375 RepID=A0A941EQU6_9ACTN|nr:gamma-glutamyltransferase [Actinospica durhamensis]MBR7835478.1 gamma-glutamyltransferase [Actinospica durhamensis]